MARWVIKYSPSEDERDSPYTFIYRQQPKEQAQIAYRIEYLGKLEKNQWPRGWNIKPVGDTLQMTVGDFRVYFVTDEDKYLIICHICRKSGQKAEKTDIQRANINARRYFEDKEKRKRK